MFNTDRVRVVGDEGDQTLYLDLGGGRFGPGITPEGTRYGEVEISFEAGRGTDEIDVWGTAHADHLVGSIAGFSLNADGDVDGWAWGLEAVKLFGLGGPDTLRVNGHGGDVSASGDDGSDLVAGDRFAERLSGGFGDDVIVGGDGNDGSTPAGARTRSAPATATTGSACWTPKPSVGSSAAQAPTR